MEKNIKKNYIYNVSYQILALITPLITTPYLARILGADGIGIYSYTSSIVAYFVIAAQFGIATYAQREIAYHQKDKERRSCIFYEVIILQLVTVPISLCAYYYVILNSGDISYIYWIQALNILAVFFDISWFFQGMEEFGKIVFRNFVIRLLNIILIFIIVHKHDDLPQYILLMGTMNIISGVLVWGYMPQYIVKVRCSQLHPFNKIKTVIQLFLPQIATSIYVVVDKTMLGTITGSSFENGWYEQAEKLTKMPMIVITSLGTVMMPRIAYEFAQFNVEKVQKYMMESAQFAWFLSIPICLEIIGIIPNLVPWFLGPGYETVVPLTQMLSGVVLAISFSNLLGVQYMIPTNRQNMFTLTVTIGAVINVIMNVILIPVMHALGAAFATLITECVITISEAWILRKELPIIKMMTLGIKYWFAGIIMLSTLLGIGRYIEPSSINTTILIVLGGCIYMGILILVKDGITKSILGRLKKCINIYTFL